MGFGIPKHVGPDEWFLGVVHFDDGRSGFALVGGHWIAVAAWAATIFLAGIAVGVWLP